MNDRVARILLGEKGSRAHPKRLADIKGEEEAGPPV